MRVLQCDMICIYCHVLFPQIFLVTVWHCELFMLPLFLLLLIGWNYFQIAAGKANSNQDLVSDERLFISHPCTSVDAHSYRANSMFWYTLQFIRNIIKQ